MRHNNNTFDMPQYPAAVLSALSQPHSNAYNAYQKQKYDHQYGERVVDFSEQEEERKEKKVKKGKKKTAKKEKKHEKKKGAKK